MKEFLYKILEIHLQKIDNIKNDNIKVIKIDDKIVNDNKLTPWETVKIARSNKRPKYNIFISNIIDDFIEFHGGRCFGDDMVIVTGVGFLKGIPVTVISNAKGATPQENVKRRSGMAHSKEYRKALRIMKQAEKFNRLIIFVDTPGAYCGVEAELRGQAIASCLYEISHIKTPVINVIHGEGGSARALAIDVGNYTYMYNNSIYVISPESAVAIVYKNIERAEEIAPFLKFKSLDLIKLK